MPALGARRGHGDLLLPPARSIRSARSWSAGKKVHESCIGNTVCFLGTNHIVFIDTAKGEDHDVTGTCCGVRTGPRLLNGGDYALNPRREGFRQPGLSGPHTRMALGVTDHRKLLLVSVATPVTFAETAHIMKKLGCVDAVCLDGGSSSAMYYRGSLVRRPGRALTNIIEVVLAPRPAAGVPAPTSGVFALVATQETRC